MGVFYFGLLFFFSTFDKLKIVNHFFQVEENKQHTELHLQKITLSQFEEIFCRYYPSVSAYAASILDDNAAGKDIAQEVFLYVWDKRAQLQFNKGFQSYLFQAAYTRCVDYIKRHHRLEKYAQQTLLNFAEEYGSYLNNNCQTLQELFSKDFEKTLNTLLMQLPPSRRDVFNCVYREGLKTKEVSEKLQMPQRTVESHIYLAMKFLRKHLSPSDFLILTLLCKIF